MSMAIALSHLGGRSIGVFGLARSGLATVRAAQAGGAASVLVWDDRESARAQAQALGGAPAKPEDWPWDTLDSLILSPGVPLTHPKPHPIVGIARTAGVEIICDVELLWREAERQARFVAITGTNGKSTTTALIGHVLAAAGLPVSVGGNIGRAALDLEALEEGRVYVLEMSSYQVDLTGRFRPDVAVWLNLTPDHLDRHGDMAGYASAKKRIFANMGEKDTAIVGVDEPEIDKIAEEIWAEGRTKLRTLSVAKHAESDLYVDPPEGRLFEDDELVASFAGLPTLRGAHNWQNAAAAWGAARALGVDGDTILAAMASFPGLAHRMEIVGRRGAVLFVNDSKATNADAAAKALATFEPIYWIAGGQAKAGGIEPLVEFFPRIAKAYLIGTAADQFSHTLAGRVPQVIAGDLATAIRMAADDAALDRRAEPAVLLSPAGASFDQFADFEARGEAFRQSFHSLDQHALEAVA
ncbi:MAG: UDP-N-acetylmuramoyl-L-alanine--D-glutamate ligase [Pseudomonadota bacterium]|nr:UDP-N-acetylmuramoyl-L-alanine--D-glutamate ligase [Pseudomonadota bacterium]